MHHRLRPALLAALLTAAGPTLARADDAADIRARLERWAEDFNAGRTEAACGLFSKSLRSDVSGQGEADYETRCRLLGRAIDDKARRFRYTPRIREILVAGDLAVVRLDWKLEITPGDIAVTETGMDIFRKEADGVWRIIRFMSFDAEPSR
jgi:steroid delta-isomerase